MEGRSRPRPSSRGEGAGRKPGYPARVTVYPRPPDYVARPAPNRGTTPSTRTPAQGENPPSTTAADSRALEPTGNTATRGQNTATATPSHSRALNPGPDTKLPTRAKTTPSTTPTHSTARETGPNTKLPSRAKNTPSTTPTHNRARETDPNTKLPSRAKNTPSTTPTHSRAREPGPDTKLPTRTKHPPHTTPTRSRAQGPSPETKLPTRTHNPAPTTSSPSRPRNPGPSTQPHSRTQNRRATTPTNSRELEQNTATGTQNTTPDTSTHSRALEPIPTITPTQSRALNAGSNCTTRTKNPAVTTPTSSRGHCSNTNTSSQAHSPTPTTASHIPGISLNPSPTSQAASPVTGQSNGGVRKKQTPKHHQSTTTGDKQSASRPGTLANGGGYQLNYVCDERGAIPLLPLRVPPPGTQTPPTRIRPPVRRATSKGAGAVPKHGRCPDSPSPPAGAAPTAPPSRWPGMVNTPRVDALLYSTEVVPHVKPYVPPNSPYWVDIPDHGYEDGHGDGGARAEERAAEEVHHLIPGQSYMGLAVVVTMCFNCPIGMVAILISMSALRDFEGGRDKAANQKARLSLLLSLAGVVVTVAVMMGVVYQVAYKDTLDSRG